MSDEDVIPPTRANVAPLTLIAETDGSMIPLSNLVSVDETVSPRELNHFGQRRAVTITANLTPRKCLGFTTPFQAILKELGKDVQIRFS